MTAFYEDYDVTASLSAEDHKWTARAACTGAERLMFPKPTDKTAIESAKRFCATCPVRQECEDEAFRNGEQHGVWGGWTPEERWEMLRKRGSKIRKWPHLRKSEPK